MIILDRLETGYMQKPVLHIPHQEFGEGKIISLIGRNGSGKSTLLKTMVGLLPYKGSVKVDGRELSEMRDKERARFMSYLPQSLTVPDMDVATLVVHGRYVRLGFSRVLSEADRQAVRRAMEITDVAHLKDRRLRSLSGGERQRAFLAMVIAQDTKMLLLDEPSTYMDVAHQKEITEILQRLAEGGKGVILASHDLQQSFSASDQLCILDHGEIAACGTPEDLAARPDLLRASLGVALKKCCDPGLLYPFVLSQ